MRHAGADTPWLHLVLAFNAAVFALHFWLSCRQRKVRLHGRLAGKRSALALGAHHHWRRRHAQAHPLPCPLRWNRRCASPRRRRRWPTSTPRTSLSASGRTMWPSCASLRRGTPLGAACCLARQAGHARHAGAPPTAWSNHTGGTTGTEGGHTEPPAEPPPPTSTQNGVD